MEYTQARRGYSWLLLVVPPLLFLVAIIAASLYFGILSQGNEGIIIEAVQLSVPHLLLAVQILLLGALLYSINRTGIRWQSFGWSLRTGQNLSVEIVIGTLVGVILALAYLYMLSPLLAYLQSNIGDYVPPDQLLTTLGSARLPFFVANVVLAPFVEENIYRGYGLAYLTERYGTTRAVVISCVFFGLLHWTGGFWYMMLTGLLAGGLFCGLRLWRKTLITPFVAHLVLNTIEFLFTV